MEVPLGQGRRRQLVRVVGRRRISCGHDSLGSRHSERALCVGLQIQRLLGRTKLMAEALVKPVEGDSTGRPIIFLPSSVSHTMVTTLYK